MIETEHPAETFGTTNRTGRALDGVLRRDQAVPDALVVPILMVVRREFPSCLPQRSFPEEDHAVEALLLDGPYGSLGVGVQVWRTRGQQHDLDPSCCEFDDEEDVDGDQPARSPDLDREEVRGRETAPVRPQELGPGRLLAALGSRLDALLLQDVGDGGSADVVTDVSKCTLDPGVAPVPCLGPRDAVALHRSIAVAFGPAVP
jgi:hypothetical protein